MLISTAAWPPAVRTVLTALVTAGFDAVLVGGSVRDLLLQRPVHDWDIATAATPEQVNQIFARTVPTGLKHGTVTVLVDEAAIEVTTFRIESHYSDGRRPDSVTFTSSLDADLARRDFTINAMAVRTDGQLVDPMGGQADLAKRQIRAVGAADRRFAEDALRILRGLRLAATLSFSIEPETLTAMQVEACRLRRISNERIGAETLRILAACEPAILSVMATGPWIAEFGHPWPTAGDSLMCVAEKLTSAIRRSEPPRHSRQFPDNATWRANLAFAAIAWQAHWSAPLTAKAARAMVWPKRFQESAIHTLRVLSHDCLAWTDEAWMERLFTDGLDAVYAACILEDGWANEIVPLRQNRFERAVQRLPLRTADDLQVTGHDLMAIGLTGKAIGRMKFRLIHAVLRGRIRNDRAELIRYAEITQHLEETGDDT